MTDDERDPFEDDPSDESAAPDDPFARSDEDALGGAAPEDEGDADDPLFGEAKTEPGDRNPADVGLDTGADDPFDELGPAGEAADVDLDDVFERMDVGGVAEEDVWESLDDDAAGGGGPVGEFGGAGPETGRTDAGFGGRFGDGHGGVEHVVSKRTYCQQCPHFSAPPEVACEHEGTTIVEAVGFDEFRVRNCPMVEDDDPTFDASRDE